MILYRRTKIEHLIKANRFEKYFGCRISKILCLIDWRWKQDGKSQEWFLVSNLAFWWRSTSFGSKMFNFIHIEIKSFQFSEEIWPGARPLNIYLHIHENGKISCIVQHEKNTEVLDVCLFNDYIVSSNHVLDPKW